MLLWRNPIKYPAISISPLCWSKNRSADFGHCCFGHKTACSHSTHFFFVQEYQPFFVSPMEIIIGRNGKHNQISFFTTLDNIQRHSENFLPLAGVQLHIRGQGVVPPKTAKGEINVIVRLLILYCLLVMFLLYDAFN